MLMLKLDLDAMKQQSGFWYLASPYSKYPHGLEAAFQEACKAAAWLIMQGVRVYCPIAHTHPIAVAGGIDEVDHEIWLPQDRPFMEMATGLIVAKMETWRESYGINYEVQVFSEAGKDVYEMEWPLI